MPGNLFQKQSIKLFLDILSPLGDQFSKYLNNLFISTGAFGRLSHIELVEGFRPVIWLYRGKVAFPVNSITSAELSDIISHNHVVDSAMEIGLHRILKHQDYKGVLTGITIRFGYHKLPENRMEMLHNFLNSKIRNTLPNVEENSSFLIIGAGNSGKSSCLRELAKILSKDSVRLHNICKVLVIDRQKHVLGSNFEDTETFGYSIVVQGNDPFFLESTIMNAITTYQPNTILIDDIDKYYVNNMNKFLASVISSNIKIIASMTIDKSSQYPGGDSLSNSTLNIYNDFILQLLNHSKSQTLLGIHQINSTNDLLDLDFQKERNLFKSAVILKPVSNGIPNMSPDIRIIWNMDMEIEGFLNNPSTTLIPAITSPPAPPASTPFSAELNPPSSSPLPSLPVVLSMAPTTNQKISMKKKKIIKNKVAIKSKYGKHNISIPRLRNNIRINNNNTNRNNNINSYKINRNILNTKKYNKRIYNYNYSGQQKANRNTLRFPPPPPPPTTTSTTTSLVTPQAALSCNTMKISVQFHNTTTSNNNSNYHHHHHNSDYSDFLPPRYHQQTLQYLPEPEPQPSLHHPLPTERTAYPHNSWDTSNIGVRYNTYMNSTISSSGSNYHNSISTMNSKHNDYQNNHSSSNNYSYSSDSGYHYTSNSNSINSHHNNQFNTTSSSNTIMNNYDNNYNDPNNSNIIYNNNNNKYQDNHTQRNNNHHQGRSQHQTNSSKEEVHNADQGGASMKVDSTERENIKIVVNVSEGDRKEFDEDCLSDEEAMRYSKVVDDMDLNDVITL